MDLFWLKVLTFALNSDSRGAPGSEKAGCTRTPSRSGNRDLSDAIFGAFACAPRSSPRGIDELVRRRCFLPRHRLLNKLPHGCRTGLPNEGVPAACSITRLNWKIRHRVFISPSE